MYNYVVTWEGDPALIAGWSFIPLSAIETASDKRLVARAFAQAGVPSPATHLLGRGEVDSFLRSCTGRWVLKYPTGCGAIGHRFITSVSDVPAGWPMPCVVQEFIAMDQPAVHRLYGVDGKLFGFNARRFPNGTKPSPWVAHARGARYVHGQDAPQPALAVAAAALRATGLDSSFGCVDLLQRASGEWLALEVGTDGIHNHVDRDVDSPALSQALAKHLNTAFWRRHERLAVS